MQFQIINFMYLWTSEKVTLIVAAFSPYSDQEKGRCFWSWLLTSAGCGHTFQLCARNHVCLWEQRPYISDPQDSWTSLPPASTTGWYNYLFHYLFFFFTHLNIFGLFFLLSPQGTEQSWLKCQPRQLLFLKLFRPLEARELDEEFKSFLEINFIFHLP